MTMSLEPRLQNPTVLVTLDRPFENSDHRCVGNKSDQLPTLSAFPIWCFISVDPDEFRVSFFLCSFCTSHDIPRRQDEFGGPNDFCYSSSTYAEIELEYNCFIRIQYSNLS